eukprot:CAMPEP_0185731892 /NCGR_PEP_ID=MMETSP1171-20130828/14200_1 /TAXON_ID=374046 /ORGANISM="Helicotheca tamensis, Strain CCMP826" /LENGTH=327 /DNA_ID=CAMNT_0028401249 /DNA_START=237 /DNA_END=1220 /DNA_ORIENTATION=+
MRASSDGSGDGSARGSKKKGWWRWSRCLLFRKKFHHCSEVTEENEGGRSESCLSFDSLTTLCPAEKNLFTLMNLNPSVDEERQLFDEDAVIQEVKKDPQAAARAHAFKSFWYQMDSSCYPLHQAIMLGASLDVVDILYKNYPPAIKKKCCNPDELTALHIACKFGSSPEVVSFLLDRWPAAAREQDNNGNHPLHFACLWDAPLKVILLLLERWPEASTKHYYNIPTPLQTSHSRCASADIQNVLFRVSHICTEETDQDKSKEAADLFKEIRWCGGIMLVLDRYPDIARTLAVDIKVMPGFLSLVGYRCKVSTMWSVISNMQELFVDI